MATKSAKIEQLKELGVELTGEETLRELDALLAEHNVDADDLKDEPEGDEVRPSGITVKDSSFDVRELPLIVTLPEGASEAQIERAKILNAYAYSNPIGWASRKEHLLVELEALKDAPAPKVNPNAPKLTVGAKVPEELSA